MCGFKLNRYGSFSQLEAVGHGSETQLQVGEIVNTSTWWDKKHYGTSSLTFAEGFVHNKVRV